MKNLAILVVLVAVIALVAFFGFRQSGFFGLPANASGQDSVKIGVMLALTGDAAIYGESVGNPLELAREEINAQGGILGKKIEFVVEDSACNANAGVKAMNSLVNLKGMKIVISGDCSGPTLAAAPIAEQQKVLFLVAVASNPDIKNAGEYAFRVMPSDALQGKDLAMLLFKKGFSRPAILFMDNAYGKGIEIVFSEEFAKLNGTIAEKQMVNQADADFRTPLLKIKESNPDSLLIVGYPQMYQIAIKQFFEVGLNVQIFASETFKDSELLKALGEKANGIIFTNPAESNSANFLQFKENYKKKFGKDIGPYGDFGYDALFVLKAGIEQAKSFDPEVLKKSFYGLDYNGVTGETKFDSFGEVDKPYGVMAVNDLQFVKYNG